MNATPFNLPLRIKAGLVALAKEAKLAGIGDRVYDQILPEPLHTQYPCVVVTAEDEVEETSGATTGEQYWDFPYRVFFADRDAIREENQAKYLDWRQRLMQAMRRPPRRADGTFLPGAPEACDFRIVPKVRFDSKAPAYQMVVSGFVVKVTAAAPAPTA